VPEFRHLAAHAEGARGLVADRSGARDEVDLRTRRGFGECSGGGSSCWCIRNRVSRPAPSERRRGLSLHAFAPRSHPRAV
jgi:hypothetical protein